MKISTVACCTSMSICCTRTRWSLRKAHKSESEFQRNLRQIPVLLLQKYARRQTGAQYSLWSSSTPTEAEIEILHPSPPATNASLPSDLPNIARGKRRKVCSPYNGDYTYGIAAAYIISTFSALHAKPPLDHINNDDNEAKKKKKKRATLHMVSDCV